MKEIVTSIGTLAMWWVVGYAVQTAARVMEKIEGPLPDAQNGNGDATPQPRLVA